MKLNTYILSTAELDHELVQKALDHGIEIDAVSFIQVEPIRENNLSEDLLSLAKTSINAVFTSANAINSIGSLFEGIKPNWNIYCIGKATKKAVMAYFDASQIKATANDGAGLAAEIKANGVKDVVFFCGDKRLDALPDFLYKHDIMVREIVVYKTKETPEQVKKHYQGIMFYSPNGVNSFFRINTPLQGSVLFAIGNTTAKAIQEKSTNKLVVCDTPSKEAMVDQVITHFHK